MNIYVLGNMNIEEDSLPLQLLEDLRAAFPDVSFIHFDPTEEFPTESEFILIDSVVGIDSVRVLDDVTKIEHSPQYSLHDFDLGFALKVALKLGRISQVKILCVPALGKREEVLEELKGEIEKLLAFGK